MTEEAYTSALMKLELKGSFCAPLHQILSLFICLPLLGPFGKEPFPLTLTGQSALQISVPCPHCCALPSLTCHLPLSLPPPSPRHALLVCCDFWHVYIVDLVCCLLCVSPQISGP